MEKTSKKWKEYLIIIEFRVHDNLMTNVLVDVGINT